MKIVYISGGQRSGKSRFAQESIRKISDSPVYLATARVLDDEFKTRVKRHQKDRDEHWRTVEIEKYISKLDLSIFPSLNSESSNAVVLDCITLWLTNFLLDNDNDLDKTIKEVKEEWDKFRKLPLTCYIVSNEIGMGLISSNELGRKFVDLQGFINQYIAKTADETYFMVSGVPLRLK